MNRRLAVGLAAAGLLFAGVAAWFASRPAGPTGPVALTVRVKAGDLRVPGDAEGNIRVFRPTDPVTFELRLCGAPGGPVVLWTSPGRKPTWTRSAAEAVWVPDGDCQKAGVEAPASALWPGQTSGVGRWTWVAGPDAETLEDPIAPEAAWRRAPAMVDGEVVLRDSP